MSNVQRSQFKFSEAARLPRRDRLGHSVGNNKLCVCLLHEIYSSSSCSRIVEPYVLDVITTGIRLYLIGHEFDKQIIESAY